MLQDIKLILTLVCTNYSEKKEDEDVILDAPFTASQLPLIPIIGSLLAVLILLIILIDVSCYKINEIGIKLHIDRNIDKTLVLFSGFTSFLCEKAKRFKKFDPQSER